MANKDNPLKGSKFEIQAQKFFAEQGLQLERGYSIDVGITEDKKPHKFDLGSETPSVVVECKSHTWTVGGNSPSAKMSVWNEAMYYFVAAPSHFRKILFVLKDSLNGETLAEYYRLYADLWGKNNANSYFDLRFDRKWVVHLAFGHFLAIKWSESPS